MRRILGLALGLVALSFASPAVAQSTPEGAERLRAALDAWQPSVGQLTSDEVDAATSKIVVPFSVSDWRVAIDGEGYRIEAPGFRWLLSASPDGVRPSIVLICDAETLLATPTAAGTFALSSDKPQACQVTGIGQITAKSRHLTGTVDPSSLANTMMVITLDQVAIAGGNAQVPTIDRLILTRSAKAAANGRMDIDARISITGLTYAFPSGTGELAVEQILFDSDMPNTDSADLVQTSAALVKRERGTKEARSDDPTAEALWDRILAGLGQTSTTTLTVAGTRARRNAVTLAFESMALGIGYRDFDRDGATVTVRFDADGITSDPKWAYDAWTPTTGIVQFSIEKFPLWQLLPSLLSGHPPDSKAEAESFRNSRMRFDFDTTHLSAPEAALDFGGTAAADPDSVLGSSGTLRLRLTGLDGLVKALQADPAASQIAAGLSVVQVMGRQATLADGRTARDYDIVIDPSGKVLVNSVDVRSLIPKDL